MGSQRDLSEDFGTAEAFSRPSSAGSDASFPRSGARSRLLPLAVLDPETLQQSDSEEADVLSAVDDDFRVSGRRHLAAPDYDVLLEVVTRAVAKLNINWPQEEQTPQASGKLDERFLKHHTPPPRRSLPFFPDLHDELSNHGADPSLHGFPHPDH